MYHKCCKFQPNTRHSLRYRTWKDSTRNRKFPIWKVKEGSKLMSNDGGYKFNPLKPPSNGPNIGPFCARVNGYTLLSTILQEKIKKGTRKERFLSTQQVNNIHSRMHHCCSNDVLVELAPLFHKRCFIWTASVILVCRPD